MACCSFCLLASQTHMELNLMPISYRVFYSYHPLVQYISLFMFVVWSVLEIKVIYVRNVSVLFSVLIFDGSLNFQCFWLLFETRLPSFHDILSVSNTECWPGVRHCRGSPDCHPLLLCSEQVPLSSPTGSADFSLSVLSLDLETQCYLKLGARCASEFRIFGI